MITKGLVLAMIMAESSGNPNARSPAGAVGLMQLTTIGVREVGIQYDLPTDPDLLDPATNILYGTLLLRHYIEVFPNLKRAVGAFNCGYQYPWPEETREYVRRVMAWRWELDPMFQRILPDEHRPYEELVDEILERDGKF